MQFHEWPYSEYPPHANWAESSSTLQFHLSIIVQKRIANRWQCPSLGIRLRKYLVDIPCNGSHTLTNLIQLLVTLHIRVKTQRMSEKAGIMEFQNHGEFSKIHYSWIGWIHGHCNGRGNQNKIWKRSNVHRTEAFRCSCPLSAFFIVQWIYPKTMTKPQTLVCTSPFSIFSRSNHRSKTHTPLYSSLQDHSTPSLPILSRTRQLPF